MPPIVESKAKTNRTQKQRSVGSLGDVADVYAVGHDTVKRWRREGMPGKPGVWILHDISNWLRTEGPWRPNPSRPDVQGSADPILAGDDVESDALERYRFAKAKHAELDLELRKGELIEKEACREVLSRWAVLIRRMGESLGKRHGRAAADRVANTLVECEAVIKEDLANGD